MEKGIEGIEELAYGQVIKEAAIVEGVYTDDCVNFSKASDMQTAMSVVSITLENGWTLILADDYQQCCEKRYITTDDNISDMVGGVLSGVVIKDAPPLVNEDIDVHEIRFLEVSTTNKGVFTFASHNEHNGYYGGFDIKACYRPTKECPWKN